VLSTGSMSSCVTVSCFLRDRGDPIPDKWYCSSDCVNAPSITLLVPKGPNRENLLWDRMPLQAPSSPVNTQAVTATSSQGNSAQDDLLAIGAPLTAGSSVPLRTWKACLQQTPGTTNLLQRAKRRNLWMRAPCWVIHKKTMTCPKVRLRISCGRTQSPYTLTIHL
jgi:hypothetical protein